MARYTGPKCKLCRRDGSKLFLKGNRCQTAKCPIEKRSRPPGMHGFSRGRPSPYQVRLRATQKVKRFYGVYERQFRRYFDMATRQRGNTGENLLTTLERRLDNVVRVAGFASSASEARQLVCHGLFQVSGRKMDIPAYIVQEGDVIRPKPHDNVLEAVRERRESLQHPQPPWLEINDSDLSARVLRAPVGEEVSVEVDVGLVVEFCSR